MMYNPSDHCWIVGGDETHLWSDAFATQVSVDDADCVAWLE